MPAPTLVNGRAYDYVNIVLTILGVPIVSVSSINYLEEQEKTNNMGASNRPVSRGHGSIDSNGSIEVSMNDIEALRNVAPDGSLLKIPSFDIVVTFLNSEHMVRNHVLRFCEFLDDGTETSSGDTDVKRTFGLIIGEVKFR